MRSMVADEPKVGLLLFDEPSAALDPVAEHGECTACFSIYLRFHLTGSSQICSIGSRSFGEPRQ